MRPDRNNSDRDKKGEPHDASRLLLRNYGYYNTEWHQCQDGMAPMSRRNGTNVKTVHQKFWYNTPAGRSQDELLARTTSVAGSSTDAPAARGGP